MKILAIESATQVFSIALWSKKSIYSTFKVCPQKHSKYILSLVKNILEQGKTTLLELDALAFSCGPGSFTGVRIGVGFAKGIALGINCPIISISTLFIMAHNVWNVTGLTQILVAIDARIKEFYWAEYIYDKNKNIWYGQENETILHVNDINMRLETLSGKWATAGTFWKKYPEIVNKYKIHLHKSNILLPSAEAMLPIACQLLSEKKTIPVDVAEPTYLRNKVTVSKQKSFNKHDI